VAVGALHTIYLQIKGKWPATADEAPSPRASHSCGLRKSAKTPGMNVHRPDDAFDRRRPQLAIVFSSRVMCSVGRIAQDRGNLRLLYIDTMHGRG